MKSREDKYIYLTKTLNHKKYYRLYIPCDGEFTYIAENTDKQFLRQLRDKILESNYTHETLNEFKHSYHPKKEGMKHIYAYKISSGETRYMIHHTCKGKTVHHGSYHSLSEAQRVRDCLVKNDWKEECCPVSVKHRGPRNPLNKYISKDKNGRYTVARNIRCDDGSYKRVTFESGIRSLSEARCLRDWWVDHDWEWSSIDLS